MNRYALNFSLIFFTLVSFSYSQSKGAFFSDHKSSMEYCVRVLAHDSLEGRETGTNGEKKAYRFISKCFADINLQALPGNQDFLLPFDFNGGYSYSDLYYSIDNREKQLVSASVMAQNTTDCNFQGKLFSFLRKGKTTYEKEQWSHLAAQQSLILSIDINFVEACRCSNGDQDFFRFISEQMASAISYSPAAVVLYSSDFQRFPVKKMILNYPYNIPVLLADSTLSINILNAKDGTPMTFAGVASPVVKKGMNVLGFIDNKASKSILLGAHYDHLGYGDFGSRYMGYPQIHNGADDNASGTALVIELAKMLKQKSSKKYNYIIAAFSGEEKGLLGSKAFVNSGLPDKFKIEAMLNFDMVGRVDSVDPKINILGTGSSTLWDQLLNSSPTNALKPNLSNGGLGGSDQFSFYNDSIPVLFFITGLHGDYHVPTDDVEKINFDGMVMVLKYAENLIERLDSVENVPFSAVAQSNAGRSYTKGVTIGVVPDHTFNGKGMRIDGVSPGRPAEKAGLQKGDVIIKMGDFEVSDMASYMTALSKFKKGDITKIMYLRNDKTESTEVQF